MLRTNFLSLGKEIDGPVLVTKEGEKKEDIIMHNCHFLLLRRRYLGVFNSLVAQKPAIVLL